MAKKSISFLLILAMITPCIKMDILAPCFPDLAKYFHTSEGDTQLLFTITFLGYCFGALLSGPLSDYVYGRRKVIITGYFILLLSSLLCVFVHSVKVFFFLHFLQGLGSSTIIVLVYAIISDIYENNEPVKLIGKLNATIAIGMATAIILGSYLTHLIGWKANYILLVIFSIISILLLVFALPETKKQLTPFNLATVVWNYRALITQPKFIIACLVPSLLYAAYIAYFSASAFLYMKTFGTSVMNYAIQQAIIILSFAFTSMSTGKILHIINQKTMLKLGMAICSISSIWLIISCITFPTAPYSMTLFMSTFCVGFAMSYAIVFSESLNNRATIRATASSIIMCTRAILISIFTSLTACYYNDKSITIALIISLSVVLALVLILKIFRQNKVLIKKPLNDWLSL